MKKYLIITILFIFLISFISASDCEISKDDLKIEVGVYDKISENGRFIFEKSKFQPNNKSKIVQEGDVLLIESFNISIDSSCEGYNIFGDSAEISLILPDENLTSESIIIPIKFIKNSNSFDYYLEINEFMSIPDFEFLLPYNNSKGEVSHIYYAPFTLDKIGEWEIKVGYNGVWYWKNIFNEGGSFKFINVLDRIDVAQLETLEQLKEDSDRSSTNSLKWVKIIGLLTISIMVILAVIEYIIKRRENKLEDKRKQQQILKSLEVIIIELQIAKKGHLKELNKTPPEIPTYFIPEINSFYYLSRLNSKIDLKVKKIDTFPIKQVLAKLEGKIKTINRVVELAQESLVMGNIKTANMVINELKTNTYYKDLNKLIKLLDREWKKLEGYE